MTSSPRFWSTNLKYAKVSKETLYTGKKDLLRSQKRPTFAYLSPKEAYVCKPLSKRSLRLHTSLQKRPTLHTSLLRSQKRSTFAFLCGIEAKETYSGAKRGLRLILGHEPELVKGSTLYVSLYVSLYSICLSCLCTRSRVAKETGISCGKRDRYIYSPELLNGNAPVAVLFGFRI